MGGGVEIPGWLVMPLLLMYPFAFRLGAAMAYWKMLRAIKRIEESGDR